MFSYYGRKQKIAKFYPEPVHDTIVEPFAGSAAYSLFGDRWKKNVILYDKYDVIVRLWKYLIQVDEQTIKRLPDITHGQSLDDHNQLLPEEKFLIGFCINRGSAQPKIKSGKFNSWHRDKPRIAENLFKIRHWQVYCDSYENIPNQSATWFIDPPYQFGNQYYRHRQVDYPRLAEWCYNREGQTIVCENSKATWMNFSSLIELSGQRHKTLEVIWKNS